MKSTLPLDSRVVRLEAIERKLTDALTDLRTLRVELGNESRDKGVLGSRGLTRFILEQLEDAPLHQPLHIVELMQIAERAGYQLPSARNLSKRLTEYRIRTGMIGVRDGRWFWKGNEK